jgi:predicted KAP-like P-loop ATPase
VAGKKVDRAFVQGLGVKLPESLVGQFDTAERLASLMTTASGILGNPRLIKRFLNALSIRMTISKAQGVGVDEAVLAKLLLLSASATRQHMPNLSRTSPPTRKGSLRFSRSWKRSLVANLI